MMDFFPFELLARKFVRPLPRISSSHPALSLAGLVSEQQQTGNSVGDAMGPPTLGSGPKTGAHLGATQGMVGWLPVGGRLFASKAHHTSIHMAILSLVAWEVWNACCLFSAEVFLPSWWLTDPTSIIFLRIRTRSSSAPKPVPSLDTGVSSLVLLEREAT